MNLINYKNVLFYQNNGMRMRIGKKLNTVKYNINYFEKLNVKYNS